MPVYLSDRFNAGGGQDIVGKVPDIGLAWQAHTSLWGGGPPYLQAGNTTLGWGFDRAAVINPTPPGSNFGTDTVIARHNGGGDGVIALGRMALASATGYYAGAEEGFGSPVLYLRRVDAGVQHPTRALSKTFPGFTSNKTLQLKFEDLAASGMRVSILVDGVTELTFDDPTPLGGGYSWLGGRTAQHDDLVADNGIAGDITAPSLTSPTATGGALTGTGGITSNESGTHYWLVNTSATPLSIPAAGSPMTGWNSRSLAASAQTFNLGTLTSGPKYLHQAAQDSLGNRTTSDLVTGPFTVTEPPDTTLPSLTGNVVVDQITENSARLTIPLASDNVAVIGYQYRLNGGAWVDIAGGARVVTVNGLSSTTPYSPEGRAKDAADNFSTPPVVSSPTTFTTLAPSGASVTVRLFNDEAGTIPSASLANLEYAFWEVSKPSLITGAPFRKGSAGATNASGDFSLSIAGTSLLSGQVGYLIITNSDGSTGQANVRMFNGPVVVI